MQEHLTSKDLYDYAEARVQADRAARQAEPCAWMQNIDAALKEPLFHELRAVMGTENIHQNIALLQTLRRYRAKALDAKGAEIAALRQALGLFIKSAYPVATEIDPRGHNWSMAYLESALENARLAMAQAAQA